MNRKHIIAELREHEAELKNSGVNENNLVEAGGIELQGHTENM
jgi:hypothetical protein